MILLFAYIFKFPSQKKMQGTLKSLFRKFFFLIVIHSYGETITTE